MATETVTSRFSCAFALCFDHDRDGHATGLKYLGKLRISGGIDLLLKIDLGYGALFILMHPSISLFVASPTAAVAFAFLLGVGTFLDLGGEDYDVPLTAGSLLEAVEESDEGKAEWLLRSGVVVDWLLAEVLAAGADVNAKDEMGETVVHAVVRRGESRYLPLFWSHGADANATNRSGEAPVHLAIAVGATELVAELHEGGAELGLAHPKEGAPVIMALERMDLKMLRQLLELGADVEAEAMDGRRAVELALDRRDFDAARLLADHGANLDGHLYEAVNAGDGELVLFLLEKGADANPEGEESPLVAAVRGDRLEMSGALLQAGAKLPEGKICAGQGLFHLAVSRGHREVVHELLKQGADVNEAFAEPVKDEFLEFVKSEGKIKWFLKKDRRVTPLMMAADSGDLKMVRLLMEYGAETNTWTRRHRLWAVNFASQRGDVPMMQLMLGADPDHEERWVKVDLSEQTAWVYGKNNEVLLKTRVSTGKKGYRTPTGSFVVSNKYRHWNSTIYNGASMPYFQRLSCGDFGFHQGSVPNYPASHGCLRVPSGGAYKLYKVTRVGDRVEIVE
jgi:ankyrin repeat protein